MYNFLFGGFDTLANCDDDDDDDDELDSIPSSRKTKDGYLKDGFVVDEEDDEDEEDEDEDDEDEDEDEDEDGDDAETNYDEETTSENEYETDDSEESEEPHKPELAKKKCATSKKPKKRVTKDEIVTPSFELVEEAYEYADD
jgi:hypothetical protein